MPGRVAKKNTPKTPGESLAQLMGEFSRLHVESPARPRKNNAARRYMVKTQGLPLRRNGTCPKGTVPKGGRCFPPETLRGSRLQREPSFSNWLKKNTASSLRREHSFSNWL